MEIKKGLIMVVRFCEIGPGSGADYLGNYFTLVSITFGAWEIY